jgi:hypothetical protein
MDWTPEPSDIAWLTNVIELLSDGGTLMFPDAMLIFTVNKVTKKLYLQNPDVIAMYSHSRVTYDRTIVVAEKIGYSVIIA